jgi:hypothetical protein
MRDANFKTDARCRRVTESERGTRYTIGKKKYASIDQAMDTSRSTAFRTGKVVIKNAEQYEE